MSIEPRFNIFTEPSSTDSAQIKSFHILKTNRTQRKALSIFRLRFAGLFALSLSIAQFPATAIELESGDVDANLDVTLTYGVTSRLSKRDLSLSGTNTNDGNLNYDRGVVSNTGSVTTELEVSGDEFGLFMRAHGFVDFENEQGERARTPLSTQAKNIVGKDMKLLDAFVQMGFDVNGQPFDLRIGSQVLNWGESTFIQNGINVINPVDVGRLRTPGSQLRDALLPVPMVSASFDVSPNMTVEGFYQFDWQETIIDPVGSYFSTNDYAPPGGEHAFLADPAFGDVRDTGRSFGPLAGALNEEFFNNLNEATNISKQLPHDPYFLGIERAPNRTPKDEGQWGFALRLFTEQLNNSEIGLFFINNHSRLPVVSGVTSSNTNYQKVLVLSGRLTNELLGSHVNPIVDPGGQFQKLMSDVGDNGAKTLRFLATRIGLGLRQLTPATDFAANGELNNMGRAKLQQLMQNPDFQKALVQRAGGLVQLLTVDRYVDMSKYVVEYPEDLKTVGLSFNTASPRSGWAIQGEYSYHLDVPLQREEGSIFGQALAPLFCVSTKTGCPSQTLAILGDDDSPGYLQGYVRRDVSQFQFTLTKVFGSSLGSDSTGFISEFGISHVHSMPDESMTPLESGNARGEFADATSYGYRGTVWLDYNNAIGAARLRPYFQFQHDLQGNSPGPGGSFIKGRKVHTLGLGIDYLQRWNANISATFHSGSVNYLSDRDFLQASLSYSF